MQLNIELVEISNIILLFIRTPSELAINNIVVSILNTFAWMMHSN